MDDRIGQCSWNEAEFSGDAEQGNAAEVAAQAFVGAMLSRLTPSDQRGGVERLLTTLNKSGSRKSIFQMTLNDSFKTRCCHLYDQSNGDWIGHYRKEPAT